MYLFILESLGTSELLLIGVIALIFLGPRRMPEIARKIGKMMADFRNTANEFKTTWEREVDLSEEVRSLDPASIEQEAERPIARENSILDPAKAPAEEPSVRQIDKESFDSIIAENPAAEPASNGQDAKSDELSDTISDKRTWL